MPATVDLAILAARTAEGLTKVLGTQLDDAGVDELERAERHYGVSSLIIQRQIENQLTSV